MTASQGTFIMGVCVVVWAYKMEIIKLPWIFTSVLVSGELGMVLRCAVTSEANTWQAGRTQIQMATVTTHGAIASQGNYAAAENISCMIAEVIFLPTGSL